MRGRDEDHAAMDWDEELRLSARYGELAELLEALENGAQVDCCDALTRNTALHYASANGHVQLVRELLQHAANPNAVNEHLNTALHWSAQNGHTDVVSELLHAGAKRAIENAFGRTPLDEADLRGFVDIKRILMEYAEAHPQQTEREAPGGEGKVRDLRSSESSETSDSSDSEVPSPRHDAGGTVLPETSGTSGAGGGSGGNAGDAQKDLDPNDTAFTTIERP
ncbi:Ankyrin repeat-containing protein [Porphyridium purpureum]|uniref:Ankyrin repeat-containing protein n=1 Tax=Porphyridium purpureum TaxID=35688 RepID=A0A5J4Z5D3_PORPP|nr:Ankyrin repeat-containing protein [Porphyridium purpureum]|eukprot:POR8748..scf295_1